jgi:sensor histidine kinase YesM
MNQRKRISKKGLINMGIILLISLGCTFYFAGVNGGYRAILLNVLYGTIIGTSIALGSSIITRTIFKNDSVYENPTKYFVISVLSVIAFIFVNVLFVNYLWFHLTQGVTFSQLIGHPFGIYTIGSELIIGTTIYLVALARYFARDLQRYYKRVSEVEGQLSKYRYDTLKNQLNPHFLFNALNTLSGLIYIDADKADMFTHRLSKLYRYVLDVQKVEVVPIETELDLVNDFLYLNNIRFDDHIKTTINIEDSNGFVVPMALQLLLENAIKHNAISESHPLQIEIKTEGNFILVRNNIQLKREREPSHELGINNLRERYAALTDEELKIEATATHFLVHIPILQKQNV